MLAKPAACVDGLVGHEPLYSDLSLSFFFFFQAEDGIRDYKVTGVQTCALPIFFTSDFLMVFSLPVASTNTIVWPTSERIRPEITSSSFMVMLEKRKLGSTLDRKSVV